MKNIDTHLPMFYTHLYLEERIIFDPNNICSEFTYNLTVLEREFYNFVYQIRGLLL